MELMIILFGIFLLTFVWWFFISSADVKEELNEVEQSVEEVVKEVKKTLPTASELKKMTKAKLVELINEKSLDIDVKKTKAKILEELEELRKKFD